MKINEKKIKIGGYTIYMQKKLSMNQQKLPIFPAMLAFSPTKYKR